MQPNPLFDDLAKLATSTGGMLLEWRREMERYCQESFEKLISKMNLVTREEFEIVREMAVQARLQNEALSARLDALEGKPASKKTAKKAE